MDPYAIVGLGHLIYRTATAENSGTTPQWNKTFFIDFPTSVNTIQLQIFDEGILSSDVLIASADIKIPQIIFYDKTHEGSYPLNGKQGVGLEGVVNLVMSLEPRFGSNIKPPKPISFNTYNVD